MSQFSDAPPPLPPPPKEKKKDSTRFDIDVKKRFGNVTLELRRIYKR